MKSKNEQGLRIKEELQWETQNNTTVFKYQNKSTYPIVLTDGDELYCGSKAEEILSNNADSVKISVYPGEVMAMDYSNGFYRLMAGK